MTDPNDPPSGGPPPSSSPPSSTGNPFPTGLGSLHGVEAPNVPEPPATEPQLPRSPPRRRRAWRGPVLGVVALLAVAALVIGGMRLLGGKHKPMPLDAKRLPPQTRALSEQQLESSRERDANVKQTLLGAELGAMICDHGGPNPMHTLLTLGDGSSSGAKLFFKRKSLEDVQALMDCGSTLAKAGDLAYVTSIQFDEGDKSYEVTAAKLGVDELPAKVGFFKQAFSGLPGYCYQKPDADSSDDVLSAHKKDKKDKDAQDCDDGSFAALRYDKTWFFGRRSALDVFAHGLQRPKDETSTLVEMLQDAADATDGLPRRHVQAHPKTARLFLTALCGWGGSKSAGKGDDFQKACFPASVDRTIEDIDGRVRAAAFEMDPDVEHAEAIKANMVLVARDEGGAKELEKDVTEVVRDWKSHVENNQGKLRRLANKDPATLDERTWVAIVDTFVRAVKGAKVSRSGRTVRVVFDEKLDSSDKQEMKEAMANAKSDEKRASVAKVLDAIVKDQPLPEEPLANLVGPKWAAYLAESHTELTDADCAKIQAKLAVDADGNAQIKREDIPDKSGPLYYRLKRTGCGGKDMGESLRTCLLAATDAESFGKCKAIEEPTEKDFGIKKEPKSKDKDD